MKRYPNLEIFSDEDVRKTAKDCGISVEDVVRKCGLTKREPEELLVGIRLMNFTNLGSIANWRRESAGELSKKITDIVSVESLNFHVGNGGYATYTKYEPEKRGFVEYEFEIEDIGNFRHPKSAMWELINDELVTDSDVHNTLVCFKAGVMG